MFGPRFSRHPARNRARNHKYFPKPSVLCLAALIALAAGCNQNPPAPAAGTAPTNAPTPTPASTATGTNSASAGKFTSYTYEVVNTYPHDPSAFTQGLVFLNGHLFESTGLTGQSSLREVDLTTGNVLRNVVVPAQYFAEGLALLDGKMYQLTWKNQKGFVYDLATFKQEKEFSYTGEGWGLATDGHLLILSDGTSQIRFLDPATFEVKRTIDVLAQGKPLNELNELEYIKGEIYANVWRSDYVVRIDPATGTVTGVIDFTRLLAPQDRVEGTDVLNGIAYDAATDRLFVTGKHWPKLYEVKIKPQ